MYFQRLGSFLSYIIIEVGDGSLIFFWHSSQCDGASLRDRFPSRFTLALDGDALVFDHMGQIGMHLFLTI